MADAAPITTPAPTAHGNTLPELVSQELIILRTIMENGGELTPELETALSNVQLDVAQKIDGYIGITERFEHEAKFFRAKAAAFSKLAMGCDRVADRIWTNLKQGLIALGDTERMGVEHRLLLVPGKDKVVIDESKLPAEYKMQVITHVADREKIVADMELCVDVPGCSFERVSALRSYPIAPPKPAKAPKVAAAKKPAKGTEPGEHEVEKAVANEK